MSDVEKKGRKEREREKESKRERERERGEKIYRKYMENENML